MQSMVEEETPLSCRGRGIHMHDLMKRVSLLATLIALFGIDQTPHAKAQQLPKPFERRCYEPIGRVPIVAALRFEPGDLLCPEDYLSLAPGRKVEVLCFSTGKVLQLGSGLARGCY